MNLSIVIPLYNEQDDVLVTLDELVKTDFGDLLDEVEFIVVDDCSSDNSYENVRKYISDKPNFKLIKHEINQGKGAAVKTGFSHATGDVFFIQDADLELSPSDIPAMVSAMKELKVELVNGSRYLPG